MRKINNFIRDNKNELKIFRRKPQINNPNLFSRLRWRMKFTKSKHSENKWVNGRCVSCDAGNPKVECSTYYCPCSDFQNLKRNLFLVFFQKILVLLLTLIKQLQHENEKKI